MIIGIVVPHNFYAPWGFVRSCWGLGYPMIDEIGPDVAHNRNKILRRAKQKGEDVLLIDSDVEFTVLDVINIENHLKAGKGVITGVCVLGDIPYHPALFKRDGDLYDYLEIPNEVSKIDGCGGAFLGISKDTLAQLPSDPFYRVKVGEQMLGNDLSFCRILNEKNIDIWCDPSIRVGHIKARTFYPMDPLMGKSVANPVAHTVADAPQPKKADEAGGIKYPCRCFKCHSDYESDNKEDLDGEGYCSSCKKEKEHIVQMVNAQVQMELEKNPPVPSALAQYDALRIRSGATFPNARDLGL